MDKNSVTVTTIDAQHLTIQCLIKLPEAEMKAFMEKIKMNPEYSQNVKEQLDLCAERAEELKKVANADEFEAMCKTMIKLQKNTTSVLKKEYMDALGLKYNPELSRLEKGKAIIKKESIDRICSGFTEESPKRFWRNQLLYLYPSVDASKWQQSDVEYQCLKAVYDELCAEQYQRICTQLTELEELQMESLFKDAEQTKNAEQTENAEQIKDSEETGKKEQDSKMGEPPYKLYEIIGKQAEANGISIEKLYKEELGITRTTWYDSWRKLWMEAEEKNFSDGVPEVGISRIEMMLLAVIFDFTYFETVLFLAIRGYRFSNGEPDKEVIHYLKNKDEVDKKSAAKNKEEMKDYLKKGIYYKIWAKR